MKLLFASAALLVGGVAADASVASEGNPVSKVLSLMKKLGDTLVQEGKDEAAAYDKFACFCKEQLDDKHYSIEQATEKITKLDAEIGKLGGDISALDGDIIQLGKDITGLDDDMKKAQDERDGEHKSFLASLADMQGAIDACKGAVQALKEAAANTGAASLAQVKVVATTALALGSHVQFSDQEMSQLSKLMKVGAPPGEANAYDFSSGDIITTIDAMQKKFTTNKANLEKSEFDANAEFESRQISMANERKFTDEEKKEKEAQAEEKREAKAASEKERTGNQGDKTSDNDFLQTLIPDCEKKATVWDSRSQSRADELNAITQAETILKEGAEDQYAANKKLASMLQTSKKGSSRVAAKAHWVWVEDSLKAPLALKPSFLQISSLRGAATSSEGAMARAANTVVALLKSRAESLNSPFLNLAALKVIANRGNKDHFVKVRQICKDLIARLEADAAAEKTKKESCDDLVGKAVKTRDEQAAEVEEQATSIAAKEAKKQELAADIVRLAKQIADLKKALMEATELRETETAENAKTVAMATEGLEAVKEAVRTLKAYYDQHDFLQLHRSHDPVDTGAPEFTNDEYAGAGDKKTGIMELLEVVINDNQRTIDTVDKEEKDAVTAYDAFKIANENDATLKEGFQTSKEGEVADINDDIVKLKTDLNNAEALHKSAEKELEVLHTGCASTESFEDRTASREKEIEALKEAQQLLRDWKSF